MVMRPFFSTARALGSFVRRSNCLRSAKNGGRSRMLFNQTRCLSGIAPVHESLLANSHRDANTSMGRICCSSAVQRRSFLGCGDGGDGGVLSKVYEERRIIGYSPEQLFDVVAAVDLYHGFVPWCQQSEIVRRYPDGSFDGEMEIGFKFLVENYVSHVELNRPKCVKTTVSESSLFDHLINIWEFNRGPIPGTCNLYFLVDFKFKSPLYRQVASMFFKEVVSRLVGSFSDRCRLIYGPAVPVLENSYEQRA